MKVVFFWSIHVYMHTCIHVYMYTCIHVYMHACIHVWMYTCMHVSMYACRHVYMYTCIHAYLYTCRHVVTTRPWKIRICNRKIKLQPFILIWTLRINLEQPEWFLKCLKTIFQIKVRTNHETMCTWHQTNQFRSFPLLWTRWIRSEPPEDLKCFSTSFCFLFYLTRNNQTK